MDGRQRLRALAAALGAIVLLEGCACCGPRYYGDTERAVQWPSRNKIDPTEYDRALARAGWGR